MSVEHVVADLDKGDEIRGRAADVAARLDALDREVASLRHQIQTERLVVVDGDGRERLVASVVGPAIELRMPLTGSLPGRTTGVVVFAVDGRDGLPGGVGVQLWGDGTLVRELTLWEDELPS